MVSGVKKTLIAVMGLLVLLSGAVWAQNTENGDEVPTFVRETVQRLKQEGWTEEELERFRAAAQNRNWEDAEGADPEVVAMALQLAKQDREQLEGAENADLALELARVARNMKRSGYERSEIARTAFDGTRDVLQNMVRIREEARSGEDGKAEDSLELRERVRSQIRERLEHVKEQRVHGMKRRKNAEGRRPEIGKPEGTPGSGGGAPGDGPHGNPVRE
jgi:uncharacterized protein YxeA